MLKSASIALAVLAAACPGRTSSPQTTWVEPPRAPQPPPPRPSAAPTPAQTAAATTTAVVVMPEQIAEAKARLLAKHGAAHRERIERGVDQVAALWRAGDGDLAAFCVEQFVAEPAARDALFARLAGDPRADPRPLPRARPHRALGHRGRGRARAAGRSAARRRTIPARTSSTTCSRRRSRSRRCSTSR